MPKVEAAEDVALTRRVIPDGGISSVDLFLSRRKTARPSGRLFCSGEVLSYPHLKAPESLAWWCEKCPSTPKRIAKSPPMSYHVSSHMTGNMVDHYYTGYTF